jgi:hypothetical protein
MTFHVELVYKNLNTFPFRSLVRSVGTERARICIYISTRSTHFVRGAAARNQQLRRDISHPCSHHCCSREGSPFLLRLYYATKIVIRTVFVGSAACTMVLASVGLVVAAGDASKTGTEGRNPGHRFACTLVGRYEGFSVCWNVVASRRAVQFVHFVVQTGCTVGRAALRVNDSVHA